MALIPEWARPFVEFQQGGDPRYFDAAGYALPTVDVNGQYLAAPSIASTGRGEYARLLPGVRSWGVDPEGNEIGGPRYNEDGSPILMDGEGNQFAEMVPYWNPQGLFNAVAQQFGAGYAEPLQNARTMYERSEIPQAGISWDQFLGRQYVNPRTIDVPGLGQFLAADARNEFDWGLGDRSSFLETVLGQMLPAALTMYGIGTGIGNLASAAGIGGGASSGVGALGDAVTGVDSLADFNGLVPSNAGGGLAAAVEAAGAAPGAVGGGVTIGGPAALADVLPASLGGTAVEFGGPVASVGGPAALASTLPAALGGTAVDFGAGALNAAATALPAAAGATAGSAAGAAAGTAATSGLGGMINNALGTSLTSGDMDLIGRLLGTGIGALGANAQADAQQNMFQQFMGLGAPYRASLASLEANPAAYYESPEVKGALQQGSDALARSLSAKVGNPILNPTALQEMQNYTTTGLIGQLNQRRNFLAGAGGLGVSQAAPMGMNAAQASTGIYDALGSGVRSVFGNQRDYASELLDILRNQNSLGSGGGLTVKLS